MRYYSIKITDPTTGNAPPSFPAIPGAKIAGANFTSFLNGQTDPGALNIELDIQVAKFATPAGGSFCRIWGIPLQQIAQAANLNLMNIEIYAGMAPGLPLATAAANSNQQGLIAKGSIQPAFGNWVGTDMTLDLILWPPLGSGMQNSKPAPFGDPRQPANIIHNWPKGTSLSSAITTALKTAFPSFTTNINISSNLVLPYTDTGFYTNIVQYGKYLLERSLSIIKTAGYSGITISQSGTTINVSDNNGAANNKPIMINFQDLIGQPTWYGLNVIQVKTMMRADLGIDSMITMPPTLATTTAQSAPQFRSNSAFQGSFMVQKLRHVGNFRQPPGDAWNTTFQAVQQPAAASS